MQGSNMITLLQKDSSGKGVERGGAAGLSGGGTRLRGYCKWSTSEIMRSEIGREQLERRMGEL